MGYWLIQPAHFARRLAQRAERPRRGLSALWASRRASAQAVTSKWQLRTTSPMNTNSSEVKMGFRRKTGRRRAVYESIRKIPTGKTKQILVASQPSIRFFPLMARNGPFRPFFGPQGAKMGKSLFNAHPEGATRRPSRVHPGHPFPI